MPRQFHEVCLRNIAGPLSGAPVVALVPELGRSSRLRCVTRPYPLPSNWNWSTPPSGSYKELTHASLSYDTQMRPALTS